jgi:hypothetical protein
MSLRLGLKNMADRALMKATVTFVGINHGFQ